MKIHTDAVISVNFKKPIFIDSLINLDDRRNCVGSSAIDVIQKDAAVSVRTNTVAGSVNKRLAPDPLLEDGLDCIDEVIDNVLWEKESV